MPNKLPLFLFSHFFPSPFPSTSLSPLATCLITETFQTPRKVLLRPVARLNTHNNSPLPRHQPTRLLRRQRPFGPVPQASSQVQVPPVKPLRFQSKLENGSPCQVWKSLLTRGSTVYFSPHGRDIRKHLQSLPCRHGIFP